MLTVNFPNNGQDLTGRNKMLKQERGVTLRADKSVSNNISNQINQYDVIRKAKAFQSQFSVLL